ncbi:MAG: SixA phosphatase family protein [Bacteroidota bacterium]|jgi:phosphohistidine phosphatase
MKHLLLIRHAKSDWDIKEFPDFGRGLNKRGLREASEMKKNLSTVIPSINKFICSPAARTIQTLSIILGQEISNENIVSFEPNLYLAESKKIMQIVKKELINLDFVAIVGHNNGISDFLNLITQNKFNLEFPTGSWVLLENSSKVSNKEMSDNWRIIEKSW